MDTEKQGTVMRGNLDVPQSTYVVPDSSENWEDESKEPLLPCNGSYVVSNLLCLPLLDCVVEICSRDGGLFSD